MAWGIGEKRAEVKRSTSTRIVELGGVSGETGGDNAMQTKTRAGKNLAGGMEMLDLEFLLGVIEHTEGEDKNDVAMRKLSFNEILRREQQSEMDSSALTVYSVDEKGLYGKDIQCAAMKELTRRTTTRT